MYVCVCNAVTDSDIRDAVDHGVRNLRQLTRLTNCGSNCGCCKEMAVAVLQQTLAERQESWSMLPIPQLA